MITVGARVRLPGGLEASVLAVDAELVEVQLDGEAIGRYPVDQVELVDITTEEE